MGNRQAYRNILKQLNFISETYKKSPVAHLREYCEKKHLELKFEEEEITVSELSHPKIYKFTAVVSGQVFSGVGTSRKKAQHAAAYRMLVELEGLPYQDDADRLEAECFNASVSNARRNPVGDLDRFAQQLYVPPPIYEMSVRINEHCPKTSQGYRVHVCAVTVNGQSETAESNQSKKQAKRQAAEQMLELLKSLPTSEVTLDDNSNQSDDLSINHNDQSLSTDVSTDISETPPTHKKLPSNWSDLVKKAELYSQLCCEVPLKSADIDSDIEKLNSIAEVEYINLEETTVNGEHQCLVRILSSPLLVFHGLAESHEGAKQAAARRALEYLRDNLHNGSVNSR